MRSGPGAKDQQSSKELAAESWCSLLKYRPGRTRSSCSLGVATANSGGATRPMAAGLGAMPPGHISPPFHFPPAKSPQPVGGATAQHHRHSDATGHGNVGACAAFHEAEAQLLSGLDQMRSMA